MGEVLEKGNEPQKKVSGGKPKGFPCTMRAKRETCDVGEGGGCIGVGVEVGKN
jgi:hypothetical protein